MKTIFVADLHIDINEKERLQTFANFLTIMSETKTIYIMGDLFNFWAGNAQAHLGYVRSFLKTLSLLARQKKIFFMAGNRDFLFVPFFKTRLCGIPIFDGHTLFCGTNKLLLYHGDSLCTSDVQYLKMKKLLQTKYIYYISRLIPSNICVKIGKKFRKTSQKATKQKKSSDLDLDSDYMLSLLQKHNANILICGHTHKPHIKTFTKEGNIKYVYVLPECKQNIISYLEWDNENLRYKEWQE